MVTDTVPAPPKPKRYYAQYTISGWTVIDRWNEGVFYHRGFQNHPEIHSIHNTREEAEAVALALNELTG